MNGRSFARWLLPPAIPAVLRRVRLAWAGDPAERYARGEAAAWSPSYFAYRDRIVDETLRDPELMQRFRQGGPLPPGYGVRVDERAVEYPWALARLGVVEEETPPPRCLDAGSALNHEILVRRRELACRVLHVVTLAPESACFWSRGISYLFADLRDVPIRDAFYDAVVCISTLEHVGRDNSFFGGPVEESGEGQLEAAMEELWRVLRPGGILFLTVPFGRRRIHPAFRVFDAELLEELIETLPAARRIIVERTFYRYDAGGWQLAAVEDCADSEFVSWVMDDPAVRGPFPAPADGAVAARAVACLRIEKAE